MDLPTPVILLMMAAFAGLFVWLIWSSSRLEKRRRADYEALAAARGMEYAYRPAQGRAAPEFRFVDRDKGMTLVITRAYSRKRGNTTTSSSGSSVLRFDDPRLAGGLAVYAPEMAAGVAGAASKLMGMFDNSIARAVLGRFLGDEIAAHLGELHEQQAPAGVGLTIMATVDPNPLFDARAIERAIAEAPPGRNKQAATMVLLGEAGLQLRVGRDLRERPEIEALLDAGQKLQAALRG